MPSPAADKDRNGDDDQPANHERGRFKQRRQHPAVRAGEKDHREEDRYRGYGQRSEIGEGGDENSHVNRAT